MLKWSSWRSVTSSALFRRGKQVQAAIGVQGPPAGDRCRTPPETPGLGIEVDEALARAHPFEGTGLHLEMQDAPCDYVHGNRFTGGAPLDDG